MKITTKNLITFLIFNCSFLIHSYAQVGINNDGSNPDASAMLEVKSTDKGILIPRMTTTERTNINSPATGLLVFDNTTNSFWFFDGTNWTEITNSDSTTVTYEDISLTNVCTESLSVGTSHQGPIANKITQGWQSFTNFSDSFSIVQIEVLLLGALTNGQLNIYQGQGTGGTLLYQMPVSLTSSGWKTINIPNGQVSLVQNQVYTIQLVALSGDFDWAFYGDNDYTDGRANWSNTMDYVFKIHKEKDCDSKIITAVDGNTANLNFIDTIHFEDGNFFTGIQLQDADKDTKIQVEKNADEDVIRFDIGGQESMIITKNVNNDTRLILDQSIGSFFIGNNGTGQSNTGEFNIGMGHDALRDNLSGNGNIGIGHGALRQNTTGDYNLAISEAALHKNTIGQRNVSLGAAALSQNTTGNNNIAVGFNAGLLNTTGNQNIFIGTWSGRGTTNIGRPVVNNVIIGHEAGMNNDGDANVFLGYQAGQNESGSNKLYIENSNSTSPLIYGEFDNDLLRVNGTLNINNAFSFPTADGTSGQILQTDGSGSLAWTALEDIVVINDGLKLRSDTCSVVPQTTNITHQLLYVPTSTNSAWQSFTSSANNILLDNIEVYLATPLGNGTLNIYSGEGTSGTLLYQMPINLSDNWSTIDVSSGQLTLSNNQLYTVELVKSSGSFIWLRLGGGGYSGGRANTGIGHDYQMRFTTLSCEEISIISPNANNNTVNLNYIDTLFFNDGTIVTPATFAPDYQTISLISNILVLENGGSVNLSGYLDNTDNQALSLATNTLSLTNGGSVDLSSYVNTDNQALSLATNTLSLANGGSVDLSSYVNTDNQALSLATNTLSLTNGGSVDLSSYLDNTDNQALSLATNTLSLANGGSVDLSSYVNTDNQDLTLSNHILSLTNDASTVDLSIYDNDKTTIIQDADNDTKIQVEESANEDIIRFDIGGSEILSFQNNVNGDAIISFSNNNRGNTFLGSNAGITTPGKYNVLIGQGAGRDLQGGYSNTFIGRNAGAFKTDVSDNVFIGANAGRNATTGDSSVIIGMEAGESATGSKNILIGFQAGQTQTGSNRLFIENSNSAQPLIYGEFDNDLLRINGTLNINNAFSFPTTDGTNEQVLQTDGSGNLAWTNLNKISNDNGWSAIANNSNLSIRDDLVERFSFSNNNFTINSGFTGNFGNTQNIKFEDGNNNNQISNIFPSLANIPTNADYKMNFSVKGNKALELRGDKTVEISNAYTLPTTDGTNTQVMVTNGNGTLTWADHNTFSGILQTSNIQAHNGTLNLSGLGWGMNFYIDTDANSNDYYRWYSDNVEIAALYQNGNMSIDGTLSENSDRRLKKDFQRIQNPLEKVNQLSGYTYYWKDRPDTTLQVGVIAQEVEVVLPQLVSEDEAGIKSVNYTKLSALLIEAVKEQQVQIETLKAQNAKINEIEQQNAEMKAMLEQIQAQLSGQVTTE